MSRKMILVAVLVLLVVGVGGGFVAWREGFLDSVIHKTPVSGLPFEQTQEGNRSYKEETDLYRIEATYPNTAYLVQTAGKAADDKAVDAMERYVKSEVANFIDVQDFAHLTEQDKKILGFESGRKYELGISFTQYESPISTSFAFALYQDTGGAHPNGYFKTFVWKKKTGEQLTLDDLFIPGSAYLEKISAESRRQLIAALSQQGVDSTALFDEGLSPKAENFEKFYLHEGELIIIFDPYQVAAYAAGPQAVHIPLTQLRDVLKAEFRP